MELIDETPPGSELQTMIFSWRPAQRRIVEYAYLRRLPLTVGLGAVHLLAVAPSIQHRGGNAHVRAGTDRRMGAGGRCMIVAETSSSPRYASAQGFYRHQGYRLLGWTADYYARADDRVTSGEPL
jgi:hypothetical protein